MRKGAGQAIILIALVAAGIVAAVLCFLALSTLYAVRSHARQALQIATAAGARKVDYDALGQGRTVLDEAAAVEATRTVFESALALNTFGLGASTAEIAQGSEIEAHNDVPWPSPFSRLVHERPTVVARARIPVKILVFTLAVSVSAEAEVNSR